MAAQFLEADFNRADTSTAAGVCGTHVMLAPSGGLSRLFLFAVGALPIEPAGAGPAGSRCNRLSTVRVGA